MKVLCTSIKYVNILVYVCNLYLACYPHILLNDDDYIEESFKTWHFNRKLKHYEKNVLWEV